MRYLFRIDFERSHDCTSEFGWWKCYDNKFWVGDVSENTAKSNCVRKYSTLLELKKLMPWKLNTEKRTKIVENYSKKKTGWPGAANICIDINCGGMCDVLDAFVDTSLRCQLRTHRTSSTQRTVSIQFWLWFFLIYFVAKKKLLFYYYFSLLEFQPTSSAGHRSAVRGLCYVILLFSAMIVAT